MTSGGWSVPLGEKAPDLYLLNFITKNVCSQMNMDSKRSNIFPAGMLCSSFFAGLSH